MLFLVQYDRQKGELIKLDKFDDTDRTEAEDSRLTLEIYLNRQQIEHEVVLLQAKDENALRRTHRRYFEDLAELVGR